MGMKSIQLAAINPINRAEGKFEVIVCSDDGCQQAQFDCDSERDAITLRNAIREHASRLRCVADYRPRKGRRLMNRREWSVAWRFARRLSSRRRPLTELQVHAEARHELGRPLPLRSQGYALGALWDRRYTYDELVRLAAKRREHELCKYTRDQVLA